MMQKLSEENISNLEWYAGIDVGQVNLGISFFNGYEIIAYRATPIGVYRYNLNHENPMFIEHPYNIKSSNDLHSLYSILLFIPEFTYCKIIAIEEQLAMHNSNMLRVDGAIHGFLSATYLKAEVKYVKPVSRCSFTKKYLSEFPDAEQTYLPLKKIKKEAKKDPMKIIGYEFPEFYQYIMQFVPDGKLDDICDSSLYAFYVFLEKYKNAIAEYNENCKS